ncbi:MAG: type II secretion system protein GspD [Gemmatimonadaceae bacterium]
MTQMLLHVAAVLLCCFAGHAGTAPSAAAQEPRPVERTPTGIEFNFQDADLRVVLTALAEVAGVNVVFSNLPNRTVTLRTGRPIAASEARAYLESVARANGLTLVEEGGLVRISGETPGAPAQVAPGPGAARGSQERARLFVYRLNHAPADGLANTLADVFGIARSGFSASSQDPRSLSEELRDQRLPPGFPQEPQPQPVPPARTPEGAAGGAGQGLAAGLQGPVQIVPDPRTNSLLIRASPADYETIRQAILQLDVRPMQVLIEVLIAEVRRDRQDGFGISGTAPDQRVRGTNTTIGGEIFGASAGDIVLRILDIGSIKADVVLSILATQGDVTILSRPVVLAQNNQEARVLIGSERPFIQLFRALPTDAAVRDQVVQYRPVGTQLTIRPTINPDGYVTMSVLQEVSNATAETQFGAPVISTREARTQLLVRDGQTAVLGGLIEQQQEYTASGIPILKDLPLIGPLFRTSQQRRRNVTELFLFLTPRVLRTDLDMDETTRGVRDATDRLKRHVRDPIPLLPPNDSTPPPPAPTRRP